MAYQPEIEFVQLFDVENQEFVEADLIDVITDANLEDWRSRWIPEQYRLIVHMLNRGDDIAKNSDSLHWNWGNKVSDLSLSANKIGYSIVYGGITQALMIVDVGKKCRLEEQLNKCLVYVDYVQTAPWNNRKLSSRSIKFKGCGTHMLRKALNLSKLLFGECRLGLHSLRGSSEFYSKFGMKNLGHELGYDGLEYFEMTPLQADRFLF